MAQILITDTCIEIQVVGNHRESALFENISTLGKLRFDSIALKQGTYSTRYASSDLLIYDMSHDDQTMSVILNRAGQSTYYGFDSDDIVRFGAATLSGNELLIPANSVTVVELDAVVQPPPRDQDSDCLIVHNFTINETYFVGLDLTNTCDKEIHYPGVNTSVDNPLVSGFYDDSEWFYMLAPNMSYAMNWQLIVNESIADNTEITVTFAATILGCSDDDNSSQWHYCPTSTLSHTFTINPIDDEDDDTGTDDEPISILGCMDASASNYDSSATEDDGSCQYPPEQILGCTDPMALNFNPDATDDDGSCEVTDDNQTDGGDNITDSQNETIEPIDVDDIQNGDEPMNNSDLSDDNMVNSEADEKSSMSDFVRNGLAVAVFCGLVILFITVMRKP